MNRTNANRKYGRKSGRRGFSLVEMLAVIAIIAILCGLSMVGINRYRRSLKLVETDGIAKEIYVAAQNNLTMAYSQNYLGVTDFGTPDTNNTDGTGSGDKVTADDDVYYYIIDSSYTYKSSDNATSVLDLMLPAGSIDSTVLSQGCYIIRYQKSTGTVLDVYYSSAPGYSYSHQFTKTEDYQKLIYNTSDDDNYRINSDLRKNYGSAVIGYCGNYDGNLKESVDGYNLAAPTVRGINDDILYTVITFPDVSSKTQNGDYTAERIITVTGENNKKVTYIIDETTGVVTRKEEGKTDTTFNISDSNSPIKKVTSDAGQEMPGDVTVPKGSYILVLDDITTSDMHFTDMYPDWTPGSDVTVQAEIKLTDKTDSATNYSTESNKVTLNSIFANKDGDTVKIDNIRQLENLNNEISGFNPGTDGIKVEQESNIDFKEFLEELKKQNGNVNISKKGGVDDDSDPNTFAPIDIDYKLEYDGNDHTIENIEVNTNGDAGIFGEIKGGGSEIKDLTIINPNIYSYDGNAGALAATISGGSSAANKVKVSNVAAYNARPSGAADDWTDSNLVVHGAWSAGGLIGSANNAEISSSSASLYVESVTNEDIATMIKRDDDKKSIAGGFIGSAKNSRIIGCYSGGHTVSGRYLSTFTGEGRVNVVGQYYSGGFAAILASCDVDCCYTTCSSGAQSISYTDADDNSKTQHAKVGGFVSKISNKTAIDYCYTTGRVVGDKASYVCDFYYKDSNAETAKAFTGSNNYYVDNISTNSTPNLDTGSNKRFEAITADSNDRRLIPYESDRDTADTYDKVLAVESQGEYYFLTIDQLFEKADADTDLIRNTGEDSYAETYSKSGITDVQHGDWQVSVTSSSTVFFLNGEKLELRVQLDGTLTENNTYYTVGITGETSGKTRTFLFGIKKENSVITVTTVRGYVLNGEIVWVPATSGTTFPAKVDDNENFLVITLDDVTTQGAHFYELLGSQDSGLGTAAENIVLKPGENITAYASVGTLSNAAQLFAAKSDTTNSLYDYGTNRQSKIENSTNYIYVSNARHLQNISTDISGVNASYTGYAYLVSDITWASPFTDGIYSKDSTVKYDGFRGIEYNKLVLFDGQGHTLENFVFANVLTTWNKVGDSDYTELYCCALFVSYKSNNEINIRNLVILNPTAVSVNNSTTVNVKYSVASALIARVAMDGGSLTIENVAVIDNSDDAATSYPISATGVNNIGGKTSYKAAGGLIGQVTSKSNIIISNSSVSINIRAYTSNNTHENNAFAGGFIGWVYSGNDIIISVQNSYVAGHTISGKYSTDYWNIVGERAGGLIGLISTVKKTEFTNCFTTASVSGYNYAGSFVGHLKSPISLKNVYTVAPVDGATTSDNKKGALFGYVEENGTITVQTIDDSTTSYSVYYLPECYSVSTLSENQLIGYRENETKNTVTGSFSAMYYDTKSGSITALDAQTQVTVKKSNAVIITHFFDSSLTGNEYPFNCWTKSPLASDGQTTSTYYGDWVIEGITNATTREASFYYYREGILTAPDNNTKKFISGSDAEIIVPAMDSLNTGYNATAWYICEKISSTNGFNFDSCTKELITGKYNQATGVITVPSSWTNRDFTIIAVYTRDQNTRTVSFMYDTTGSNNYTSANMSNIKELGTPQIVTNLKDVTVPTCTINGLTFMGWYSDTACTQAITFGNTAVTENIVAYAKFGVKYTVTLKYFYLDGSQTKTLISDAVNTYFSTDALPKIELLQGASNVFANAYNLKSVKMGSATGTSVTAITEGGKNYIQVTKAEDTVYYIVYEGTSTGVTLDYTVEYIFANTNDDWSYNATETVTKTLSVSGPSTNNGKFHADSSDQLMKVGDVDFYEYFTNNVLSTSAEPKTGGYIISNFTLPSATTPVLKIYVSRKTYSLSADSNTGAYIEPVEVPYGKTIYSVVGNLKPERAGYTMPDAFDSRWKYYQLGGSASSTTAVTTTTTMPAYDTVLWANWEKGTANYTVIFWYENADDTDYSYGGMLTQSGTTESTVSTDYWGNGTGYSSLSSGGTSHVHSTSCYPGTTSTVVIKQNDGGCDDEDYWTINGKKINLDLSQRSNAADGFVLAWSYSDNSGSGKCIKIGSNWYLYTGTTAANSTATCQGNTTTWLTTEYKTYFTYSSDVSHLKSSDGNGNETIKGDGTTIVNVYFTRNRYHLYVEYPSGNYSHTHTSYTGSCYTLTCGMSEHTHDSSCLSCTIVSNHTHDGVTCNYICGETAHDHTAGLTSECNTENCTYGYEHTEHTTSCYHSHDNCTLTCSHTTHTIECYFNTNNSGSSGNGKSSKSGGQYSTNTNDSDKKEGLDKVKELYTSPKNGYVYKIYISSGEGCGSSSYEYYYFYLNGTWYYLESSGENVSGFSSTNQVEKTYTKTYTKGGKTKTLTGHVYESGSAMSASHCSHTHQDSCYSCGYTKGQLICGKEIHTHTSACCSLGYHVHSASCCSLHAHTEECYGNCNAVKHTHTSACYSLTCKLAECTDTNGTNYALILYAKYKQSINDKWVEYVLSKQTNRADRWQDTTNSWSNGKTKNYFNSNYYLSTIDIMPGQDVYLDYLDNSSTYATLYYYLQTPGNVKTSTSISVNGYNFDLYKTAKIRGGSSYSFTLNEEFVAINAFTRYAFHVTSERDETVETNLSRFTNYGVYGGRTVNLYYLRDSYTLDLFVDNAKAGTYTLQSDVVLDSYCDAVAAVRPSSVESDYVFGGWYYDQACTKAYVRGDTMPTSNFILYGKWNPPEKTVTFRLSEDSVTANDPDPVTVYKHSTLEGKITDANNAFTGDYAPADLAYWYYYENGVQKRYYLQKQITEDMTLYAKYSNGNATTAGITVKYVNRAGTEIATEASKTGIVGSLFATSPVSVTGYTIAGWKYGSYASGNAITENTSASLTVQADASKNVIYFVYDVEETWSYTVNYYLLLNSQFTTTSTEINKLLDSGSITIPLTDMNSGESNLSTRANRIVECSIPSAYSNYELAYIKVNGTTVTGRSYEYLTSSSATNGTATVEFYLVPDSDACGLTGDLHFTYDGTNKLENVNAASFEKKPTFNVPGYTASVSYEYDYGTGNTTAVHAGAYNVNVYGILTLKNTSDGSTTKYLLWKAEDGNVKLIIDPKTIQLKSETKTALYNPTSVLTGTTIYGKNSSGEWVTDLTQVFCTNASTLENDSESFEAVFVVDAFRLDVGTSKNAFIMQVKSGTDDELADKLAGDYLIETEFGTLTVEWKYKVTYKFRYRSLVDTTKYDNALAMTISEGSVVTLTDSTASIDVALDSSYTNCRLVYEYGGSTVVLGNNSSYTVVITPEVSKTYTDSTCSELVVYVEPNVDLVSSLVPSESISVIFNNAEQKFDIDNSKLNTLGQYLPNIGGTKVTSATLQLKSSYYLNGVGTAYSTVHDAGEYAAEFELVLNVTTNNGTYQYLLAADNSRNVKMTVKPCKVTVTSADDANAYVDVDGTVKFSNTALTVTCTDASVKSVIEAMNWTEMITPSYSALTNLQIGDNAEGNYFTIKWKSGVNPDNYEITRVYGKLTLAWKLKVTYYLRFASIDPTNFINYTDFTFDRTNPSFCIKNGETALTTVLTFTSATGTVDSAALIPSEYANFVMDSEYRLNNVSYKFGTDGKASVEANISAYGIFGANEMIVYVDPKVTAEALSNAASYTEYAKVAFTLPNIAENAKLEATVTNCYVYIDENGEEVNSDSLVNGTTYTVYTYVYLNLSTKNNETNKTTTAQYLLNYAVNTNYTYYTH